MSLAKKVLTLFFAIMPILNLGCGGRDKAGGDPEMQRRKSELEQIHTIYMMYLKNNQRPPTKLSDLNQKQFQEVYPAGFQALQKGEYIAVWGVDINNDSGAVLAYEKDAPKKGGAVILADGTFKNMSAEEVQAATPKAAK